VDVIVTPTTPNTAPKIGETTVEIGGQQEDARLAATRFVRALNLAGVPALSVPCGVDGRGLPIGLQIFGRAFDEATVLLVGHCFEQVSGWNRRRPAL
jgi:aspartyl-tRNA(Asn)/glutamyl-tRNA(Gln) amidotransferase subunit A